MNDYRLTITTPGQRPEVRTVTAEPGDLAQAVHRHVRGLLGGAITIRLDGPAGTAHRGAAHVADLILTEAAIETGRTARPTAGPDEIRHGYTLRDIDRIARAACTADRTLASDVTVRYDTAWSAIAEALCAADEPPLREDLVRVGWQAIYKDIKAVRRLYGVDSSGRSGEVASAPRFVAYWTRIPRDDGNSIIEKIAVWQILATLWDVELAAVQALATHDDYQAAADSLGITYIALVRNLNAARRRFKRRWYAPDGAPSIRSTDRRVGSRLTALSDQCRAGHEWTPENTRWDRGRAAGSAKVRRCRACERDRSRTRRAGVAA